MKFRPWMDEALCFNLPGSSKEEKECFGERGVILDLDLVLGVVCRCEVFDWDGRFET